MELALDYSPYDITIIHGHRGKEVQDALFDSGASHKRWPDSNHNINPSHAVDFAPWVEGKVPWDDTHIFACIAGCIFAAAEHLGVRVRWGGDWDSDGSTMDQTLMDWGHVELV